MHTPPNWCGRRHQVQVAEQLNTATCELITTSKRASHRRLSSRINSRAQGGNIPDKRSVRFGVRFIAPVYALQNIALIVCLPYSFRSSVRNPFENANPFGIAQRKDSRQNANTFASRMSLDCTLQPHRTCGGLGAAESGQPRDRQITDPRAGPPPSPVLVTRVGTINLLIGQSISKYRIEDI